MNNLFSQLTSILICFLLLSEASYAEVKNTLCINEIMQSNIDCLIQNNDFPDSWIELYNPTNTDISIYQYYIGTQRQYSKAYRISSKSTIKAKSYLVIQCDKKNTGLHTSFRLESTLSGKLYLFNSAGTLLDSLIYPIMPAPNIAYGRINDGEETWGWEITPTPSSANRGGVSETLLPDPIFSKAGKRMDDPTNITISLPSEKLPQDTKIYYTTNGQEPSRNSNSGTNITIDINETTVVRAKLISDSALCRPSITHSYIFHPRNTSLPIISIVGDSSYFYSDTNGILSSALTNGQYNFEYDWRRPINAEFFTSTGETKFRQNGETAVAGGATRGYNQKSLKIYANKRFGTKKFNGVFWEEKENVKKVKSFMLRNGGNNCRRARINDALLQRIFGTHLSNLDYQAYTPVIAYINGQYKGEFGMRERSNEDYVEANYDGLENIEMADQQFYLDATARSTSSKFKWLYTLYTGANTTYSQMDGQIDVDNFMKALIAEIFATNIDYPSNNISMWRPLTSTGKWRWILKDLDFFALSYETVPVNYNMFSYLLDPSFDHGDEYDVVEADKIYQKMISFSTFKKNFINAFSVYLGDFLNPALTVPLAHQMKDEIDSEIEPTMITYDWSTNYPRFVNYSDTLASYLKLRPRIVYQQMADFFSLGTVIPMTLKPNGANVTINDVKLTEGKFDGAWYSGRTLNLNSGSDSIGWKLKIYSFNDSQKTIVKDSIINNRSASLLFSKFSTCDSISLSAFSFSNTPFDIKLRELDLDIENQTDWSAHSSISIEEPRYAYANITNITSLPNTKVDNLHAYIDFFDNNGNCFHKKILLNLQGDSQVKNNLSISFCEDDWIGDLNTSLAFGNWIPQDEFHLKSFYNDGLRGTTEIAYQLYGRITDRDNCYPKAFPLSLYINGEFYGIMSWQLKKHRDNMGLDKKTASHVWLDGTLNDKQLFNDTINWTKFEVRNPKDLYNYDGTEYDGDAPQEIIDTTSPAFTGKAKMLRSAEAKQYIIDLSHYNSELSALEDSNTAPETMRNEISKRFDVSELINYMVFSLVTNNYDGFSKNWQWFTKDGKKWSVAPYDCEYTFGHNDSTYFRPADMSSKKYDYKMENVDANGPMQWIKKYYWEDLKNRYAELRDAGIISMEVINSLVYDWYNRIGDNNYSDEWTRWPNCPCTSVLAETPERICQWAAERLSLEDAYLGYVPDSMTYLLNICEDEWNTICVPFAFTPPAGVEFYTISGIENDGVTLIMDKTEFPLAGKPYLVHGPTGDYSISGEYVESTNLSNGLLVGTLNDIYAPISTYVLQSPNHELGFYYVNANNKIKVPANHAYLQTSRAAVLGQYRIPIETEGIQQIEFFDFNTANTYNIGGQIEDIKKSGFYIMRLPNGTFKKVFISK